MSRSYVKTSFKLCCFLNSHFHLQLSFFNSFICYLLLKTSPFPFISIQTSLSLLLNCSTHVGSKVGVSEGTITWTGSICPWYKQNKSMQAELVSMSCLHLIWRQFSRGASRCLPTKFNALSPKAWWNSKLNCIILWPVHDRVSLLYERGKQHSNDVMYLPGPDSYH